MNLIHKAYGIDDLVALDEREMPSLDLPALTVLDCFVPRDGGSYMLFQTEVNKDYLSRQTDDYVQGCPYCGSIDVKYAGKGKLRLVHDVMRNNMKVDILIQTQRMFCKDCSSRYTTEIPGIIEHRQMTERLYEYLRKECFIQPFSQLSCISGFTVGTISDILDEEIEKFEEARMMTPIEAPEALGIDEKHLLNVMRGVLVDVDSGRLIDMLPDNLEHTMRRGIQSLHNWETNIKVVTTDMNNSYTQWLSKLLPNATIVIDKFHVIKDIEQRITKTRKVLAEYRKQLIEQEPDPKLKAEQLATLKIVNSNKRLFNYSAERIAREETKLKANKIATVISQFPEFELLHNLHYTVEYMYTMEDRASAEAVYKQWEELLPPVKKSDYQAWCKKHSVGEQCFESWRSFKRDGFTYFKPYILNYFNPGCRRTNAAAEGVNSLIGSVNTAGKGYSFKHLRAKCLYSSLIHERIHYSVNVRSLKVKRPTFKVVHFGKNPFADLIDDYDTENYYTFVESNVPSISETFTPEVVEELFIKQQPADVFLVDEELIISDFTDMYI